MNNWGLPQMRAKDRKMCKGRIDAWHLLSQFSIGGSLTNFDESRKDLDGAVTTSRVVERLCDRNGAIYVKTISGSVYQLGRRWDK